MIEIVDVIDVGPDFRRKEFVSIGDSLVRALPVSQVKSAKAKGSALAALARLDLSFSVACAVPSATVCLSE